MRVESPKPLRNGGWLHRLRDRDNRHSGRVGHVAVVERRVPRDFAQLAERYVRAATNEAVPQLARELGVTPEALRRLHVGWDGQAWTFPMRSASGCITGIRRRFPTGRKLAVKGSREGLFIPDGRPDAGQLFIAEGPTDTAALLSLSFAAIGRPSCTGGTAYLLQLANGRDVVIGGDQDSPGRRGAILLARELQAVCPSVKVIIPPPGLKDIRAWIQAGATRNNIEFTQENGPIVRFAKPARRAVGVTLYAAAG
jgi:hypothetical protein